MNENRKIKVVLLEPLKMARVVEIDASINAMQEIVGGLIEAIYPFNDDVCLVCNDEGKINGMPLNRAIYDKYGNVLDIIAGPAFICGCGGESFSSLSEKQAARYIKQFYLPQNFIITDKGCFPFFVISDDNIS